MIIYLLSAVIVLLCYELFRRYFPIKGITCKNRIGEKDIVILDLRGYNEKGTLKNVAMQIPYAYLRRHYSEIPNQSLHVVASDRMDINLGVRFLLRKGYSVSSFEIIGCACKGGIIDGV
ncbi:sulfurtransferase [Oceanobacillus sp. J11TS1]|uniref:sulfurtransferase n=1 Tax=Oceanobacillus sp. J11TS1 TaxID=2807191 RepID=UPI001B279D22|nr:sulfurtransferase [Oceanobacillus sp. J11TS1]GIO22286.1 hypothetical protein J11TS1_08670 [Oceanobacillus sp. J11TS1]